LNDAKLKLKFTIGEVSKILDIPIDTLRYYDKIGLLPPRERESNGYRYYDLEQFDALFTIRMLRAMDVSIEQISALLKEDSLQALEKLLSAKQTDIHRELSYLRHLARKLDAFKQQMARFNDGDVIELVNAPPCWVLLTDSIMESGDRKLGSRVQQQVRNITTHQEWIAFCHVISIVSKDNVETGQYHSYLHNGILSTIPMDESPGSFLKREARYCARKYAVIGRDRYSEIDEHYERIKQFIHKRSLRIAGDSLEVNLYNQYNHHYIEINIPVEESE